jgi:hypothetical protein
MAKVWTLGQAETKRRQAVELLARIGGDSGKFEEMSAQAYAQSRGAELLPNPARRNTLTKNEIVETLDQAADLVEEALDPELTREELVGKVKELSDLIAGEEPDDDDEDEAEE